MKKVLSRVAIASFIALVLFLASALALPCVSAQAADEPECWAVLVGISNYLYINDLDYGDDDAQDLYDTLSPVWGASHCMLLTDSQATKAAIISAIDWLAANADANDTVLFSYSGHGGSNGFICPYNSLTTSTANYIYASQLASAFNQVVAEKIVVILDSCYAGMFQNNMSDPGRVIMMACQSYQTSEESWDLGNGVYTYYVLEALANFDIADANGDYLLSAEEIAAYANPLAWAYDYWQNPALDDSYFGELALLAKFVFAFNIPLPTDAGTFLVSVDDTSYIRPPEFFLWAPGSEHTLGVVESIDLGTGTRYWFTGWSDGSTSVSMVISNGAYTANYDKEHLMTLISAFGTTQGGGWYLEGATASFSVTPVVQLPDTKHIFTGWSGDYWGLSAAASLVMDSPVTLTAEWRHEYLLKVNSEYGEPAGAGWYQQNDVAEFSVTPLVELPDTKHFFTGWHGDYSGTSATGFLPMYNPATVTADWRHEYLLKVNSEYGNPGGDGWYQEGATAEFYVTPYVESADSRHYFTGWSGSYSGADSIATMIIENPAAVTASWRHEYLLKVNSEYGNPTGAGWYKEGETASFAVTPYVELPDTKHIFTGWEGDYTGTAEAASLAMQAPRTVTADWRHEYLLQIESEYGQPTGAGWYKNGEQAQVAVEPEQGVIIRHIFTGWSGDLNSAQSTATLSVGSPKVVTANWRTDLMQLYLLIGGVAVAAGIIVGIVALVRRGRA